jgi:hypothetical protein
VSSQANCRRAALNVPTNCAIEIVDGSHRCHEELDPELIAGSFKSLQGRPVGGRRGIKEHADPRYLWYGFLQAGGFEEDEERLGSGPLRSRDPRREAMLEPEEVSAILRLNELGWGAKRIARELGISRNTARDYIAAGGWMPYRQPRRRKALNGQEAGIAAMPT